MKNWRTTIAGALTATGLFLKGNPHTAAWGDLLTAAGVLLLGSFARDSANK